MAFSPDGKLLGTVNRRSDTVSLFLLGRSNASLADTSSTGQAGDFPTALAFSPDGKLLATANSGTASVSLFSIAASALRRVGSFSTGPQGGQPAALSFSPDGRLLATANGEGTVSLFSVGRSRDSLSLADTASACCSLTSLSFSPTGALLATASGEDNAITLFSIDRATLTRVDTVSTDQFSHPGGLAFSPRGGMLAVAYTFFPGGISFFSVSGTSLTLNGGTNDGAGNHPQAVAFNPAGRLLAAADEAHRFSLFSMPEGRLLAGPLSTGAAGDSNGGSSSIAFGPGGADLAVANGDDEPGSVSLFSIGAPSARITQPRSGARFKQGARVSADYECQEASGGPGLEGCLGPVASGARIRTGRPGRYSFTVSAKSSSGRTASATASYRVLPTAPEITGVGQTNRSWREGRRPATFAGASRPPVGTTFSFTLDARARVSLLFKRVSRGRRAVAVGRLGFVAHAGRNRVRFVGRLSNRRRLEPGAYRLGITATRFGKRTSLPDALRFAIVSS